jgi:putative spermidine/putrescine transport system substrate-binding protein
MRKERLLVGVASVIAIGLGPLIASPASPQTVTVTSSGGAVQEAQRTAWYGAFTKATGIKIVEDNWNQELAKVRAQVETKSVKWDVVEITALNLSAACEEGLVERIDWSRYFDPKDFEDAGGLPPCGVPMLNASGGLAYDADKIKVPPKTWADFWDVKKWPGKRGMLYRAEQTLEVALMADGVAPKDVMSVLSAPGGVDRAFRKLDELKPHIHWWKSGSESMQLLGTGETVLTYAWNGRVAAANKADKRNFKIVFEAGFVNGNNSFAVMKGSSNRDAAIKFIQFAVSPQPLAEFAQIIQYGPPNRKALEFMDARVKATIPSGAIMRYAMFQHGDKYVNFWSDNAAKLTERFGQWAAKGG